MSKLLTKIINAGVTDEMSFISAKRIKTFNLTAFLGIFIALFYFVINFFYKDRVILAYLDLTYTFSLIFLIFFHYKRKYKLAFSVATICLAIGFSLSSLLYKDGLEFFLLLIISMNLIFYDNSKYALWAILLYNFLFIVISIYNVDHTLYKKLADIDRIENIIIWIVLQAIFLRYFGVLSTEYQKEIEDKNKQLSAQQELLLINSKALEKSNEQLQIMNDAKEKIFSIIAHDVKAPIAAIKGTLDLFNSNVLNQEDFLTLAKETSIRLEQLKDNLDVLLEWSKSQLQGIEVKPEYFDLKTIIINTINLLLTSIEFKKIKVELHVNEGLLVYADPNQISLVIRNLLNNAIKFSYAENKIIISSHKTDKEIILDVQDFGVGMDEETLQSLFYTININSKYGTYNERGTGLGLLLCREFIEKNNGSISAKSEKDKGSTFSFSLPLINN